MNIKEVVKDSLSYPLSNWKSFLILGVILVITNLYIEIWWLFGHDEGLLNIVMIAEFVTGFLSLGYLIRIIKSTIDYENALPKFNGWSKIIIDGFKGNLIVIVYFILSNIFLFLSIIFYIFITTQGFNSKDFAGLMMLTTPIYTIVITPIIALALANMAFDEKFSSAFSFGEIWDDIIEMGWGNLIALFLLVGIIYITSNAMSLTLNYLLGWINPFLATIIKNLIIIPYLYIFATRAFALVYRSSVV